MKLRNSAKAILIHEGKLLVTTYKDKEGVYHLLPGGGQRIGETLDCTLKRECREETGIEVEVNDIWFIRECFMEKAIHRVEFMYDCSLVSYANLDFSNLSMDNHQIGTSWLNVDKLLTFPLFPIGIRQLIMERYKGDYSGPLYLGEIN
jgi:8-oxo-dGTP diphosphatase